MLLKQGRFVFRFQYYEYIKTSISLQLYVTEYSIIIGA